MLPQTPVHRILVVDDDEVMRDLLDALLSQEHYRIAVAGSGEEALKLLAEVPSPDLVLTDLHMPGLSDEALAAALREGIPPGTLLIGMSGSEPPTRTRAAFDAFLLKPFDPSALAAAIRFAQGRKSDQHRATAATEEQEHSQATAGSLPDALLPLDETIFRALSKTIPSAQLGQLYDMTLADVAKRHARMEAAVAAGDLAALRREAHTVKGSCGFVGATELQALAASLETGTIQNTSALPEIPAACLRLRSMLKSKLDAA